MIEIKINGVSYKNVSEISPEYEYDYYYSVKTVDGVLHEKKRNKKTNYSIVFFNINAEQYETITNLINTSETISLEIPTGAETTSIAEYYATISSNRIKGILMNGSNYLTGLTVDFKAVNPDE